MLLQRHALPEAAFGQEEQRIHFLARKRRASDESAGDACRKVAVIRSNGLMVTTFWL